MTHSIGLISCSDRPGMTLETGLDRTTFDKLVLDHLPATQRLAVRLTGDAHAAEELVQDALLKAIRHWRTFEGKSAFSTWMTRIVINAFRDGLSRSRRWAATPEPQPPRAISPSQSLQAEDLAQHIASLVSALPLRQREVLILSAYEHMPTDGIAETLGMTRQNVRTTLSHARAKLRELLRPQLDGGEP